MQITMQVFILAAAIALLVQTTILIVLFLQLKKTTESVNRMVGDLHSRVGPILTRTQIMLDDTQPKISALVEDAAHIVYMTGSQVRRSFWAPVQKASAIVQGIKIGLDVLRSRRAESPARETSVEQEDEL